MKSDITNRQKLILEFIKTQIKTKGYPPSVREIGHAVGLKSSSTVHNHLVQLEEKGFLKRDPSKTRAIIPIDNEPSELMTESINLPVVGNVAAGSPILADQNIEEYLPIPVDFVGSGNHFILKVKGESMIEAGILDSDYLIVRQQLDATNGEIIVAIIENEATVKRLYKMENQIELRPENSALKSMFFDNVQIAGKVVGLLRRF
ncbi:MAG TPA: transcriptional repressor LexA [Syntrophomonadaceae bacterium]|nr:transcriptional repressor LexA [Syntrophomonadaceae bacterium]